MLNLNRCFIIASGYSLKEGIDKNLFNLLKNEVTIGINETIKFFNPTVAMFGDWTAYSSRTRYYFTHPLVIGRKPPGNIFNNPDFNFPKQKGLILLKSSSNDKESSFEHGLYTPVLTGAMALSLAIELGYTNIYLLGFDNCEIDGKTHWYQDIEGAGEFEDLDGNKLSGVGRNYKGDYKTSIYNNSEEAINAFWKPFKRYKNTFIVNVSPKSKITVFNKCNYDSLFVYLNKNHFLSDQAETQDYIRTIIQPYNQFKI